MVTAKTNAVSGRAPNVRTIEKMRRSDRPADFKPVAKTVLIKKYSEVMIQN
jgi:hypothetical protein